MIDLSLPDELDALTRWVSVRPFPHIVIPGAISLADAAACGAEFPPPDGPWHTFHGPLEEGKQEGAAQIAGANVAALHQALASERFVTWLRAMTGIADLSPDPERHGGGIHQSGPNARLGLHVDFDQHPLNPALVRAVNVIVFVGDHDHWLAEWEGHLILGADHDRVVAPLPGTLIAFESSDHSWHGHPVPMSADAPLRKSVPAYYYRPMTAHEAKTIVPRSTRFLEQ